MKKVRLLYRTIKMKMLTKKFIVQIRRQQGNKIHLFRIKMTY